MLVWLSEYINDQETGEFKLNQKVKLYIIADNWEDFQATVEAHDLEADYANYLRSPIQLRGLVGLEISEHIEVWDVRAEIQYLLKARDEVRGKGGTFSIFTDMGVELKNEGS